MGGDADPSEIQKMSEWIKSHHPQLKTAWYSGRSEIPEGFDIMCLDFIKLGPYIEALGGLKSPSSNQKLYRILPDGSFERCNFGTNFA